MLKALHMQISEKWAKFMVISVTNNCIEYDVNLMNFHAICFKSSVYICSYYDKMIRVMKWKTYHHHTLICLTMSHDTWDIS